jgi:hypothetical protein
MRPNRFWIANRATLARILQTAKRTSLAFLYWLQHDLGHPELKLRSDVMDTADGFSKYPYIRESRRLLTRGRVVEQDIVEEYQPGPRARRSMMRSARASTWWTYIPAVRASAAA